MEWVVEWECTKKLQNLKEESKKRAKDFWLFFKKRKIFKLKIYCFNRNKIFNSLFIKKRLNYFFFHFFIQSETYNCFYKIH